MDNLANFWAMGGYAAYVWTSYGLAGLGLGGILLLSVKSWKAREREFAELRGPSKQ